MMFWCLTSFPISSPLWQPTPHFPLCFVFQVLAGMNVHPAEFDGLKQEYSVKGYPTFCYFEWVESSHPSHLRLSPHFQGSQHQSGATSNTRCSPGLLNTSRRHGGRLTPHYGVPGGSEVASTRCKGESFWEALPSSGIPFEKVNSQKVLMQLAAAVRSAGMLRWNHQLMNGLVCRQRNCLTGFNSLNSWTESLLKWSGSFFVLREHKQTEGSAGLVGQNQQLEPAGLNLLQCLRGIQILQYCVLTKNCWVKTTPGAVLVCGAAVTTGNDPGSRFEVG